MHEQADGADADGLAHEESEEDGERDGPAGGVGERGARQGNAGVGEGADRRDRERRSGREAVLEDREDASAVERRGGGQQAEQAAGDGGVHAGLVERDSDDEADENVGPGAGDAEALQRDDGEESGGTEAEPERVDAVAVERAMMSSTTATVSREAFAPALTRLPRIARMPTANARRWPWRCPNRRPRARRRSARGRSRRAARRRRSRRRSARPRPWGHAVPPRARA